MHCGYNRRMANWLTLSKFSQWQYLVISGFQYDAIADAAITRALKDAHVLGHIDTRLDWEDDEYLAESQEVPEEVKHAYRVAALVQELRSGAQLRKSVELDTFNVGNCCSCIPNGHHRIRALQYLGMDCAPFSLSGLVSPLKELVRLAGTDCPPEFRGYFSEDLLAPSEEDICLPKRRGKAAIRGSMN